MDEILWVDKWALLTTFYAKMLTKKKKGGEGGPRKSNQHIPNFKIKKNKSQNKKIKLNIFNVFIYYY